MKLCANTQAKYRILEPKIIKMHTCMYNTATLRGGIRLDAVWPLKGPCIATLMPVQDNVNRECIHIGIYANVIPQVPHLKKCLRITKFLIIFDKNVKLC